MAARPPWCAPAPVERTRPARVRCVPQRDDFEQENLSKTQLPAGSLVRILTEPHCGMFGHVTGRTSTQCYGVQLVNGVYLGKVQRRQMSLEEQNSVVGCPEAPGSFENGRAGSDTDGMESDAASGAPMSDTEGEDGEDGVGAGGEGQGGEHGGGQMAEEAEDEAEAPPPCPKFATPGSAVRITSGPHASWWQSSAPPHRRHMEWLPRAPVAPQRHGCGLEACLRCPRARRSVRPRCHAVLLAARLAGTPASRACCSGVAPKATWR